MNPPATIGKVRPDDTRGRIIEIYGPESRGKTTVALHAVASAQAAGGIAAFSDAEHALDADYARALGVAKGTPLLEIDRVALSLDGTPVEWRLSRCNTARHHYLSEIE